MINGNSEEIYETIKKYKGDLFIPAYFSKEEISDYITVQMLKEKPTDDEINLIWSNLKSCFNQIDFIEIFESIVIKICKK